MAFETPDGEQQTPAAPGQLTPQGMGQPTPEDAGAAGLQRTPIPGGATMGQMAPELQQMRDSLAQSQNKMQSADQQAAAAKRQAVQAKAEHLRTIGKTALSAAGTMLSHLGDVGAVGTVSPGGGALQGIGRTMGARTERIQEQQKNSALIAETNARTRHTQALVHQLDNEERDKLVAANKPVLDILKEAGVDWQVMSEGQTSDQLVGGLKAGKINPAQQGAILDGTQGDEFHRGTYSIVIPGNKITLDPNNPNQKKVLDLIDQFAPPSKGKKWEGDSNSPITLQGDQFLHLVSRANQSMTTGMARDKYLLQQGIEAKKLGEAKDFVDNLDTWTHALTLAPNRNPIAARNLVLSDPKAAARWPNLDSDLRTYYGEDSKGNSIYDKMLEDYEKKTTQNLISNLDDIEKKLDNVSNTNEIAGQVANLRSRLSDPAVSADQRPRITSLLGRATAMQADMNAEEERKIKLEQTIKNGDSKAAGAQLANYETTIAELKSRGMTPEYIQQALEEAKRISGGSYNGPTADNWAKVAGDERNVQFFGNVYSLISQGGTLDQTLQASNNISQNDWKIINKVKNWTAEELGKAGVSAYAAKIVGVADDYAKVMGGSVGSDKARDLTLNLLDPNKSPEAKKAAADAMKDSVKSQAEGRMGMNPFMRMSYGSMLGISGAKAQQPQNQPKLRPGQPNNTTYMRKPDGTYMYAPNDKVEQYKTAGATVIQ